MKLGRIVPQLDTTTASIGKATIDGLRITCNKSVDSWCPFFLTKSLGSYHSFEVELVRIDGNNWNFIGIAADTLRNTANTYNHADSLVLMLIPTMAFLCCEGKQASINNWQVSSGTRVLVIVDRIDETVEWRKVHPTSSISHIASIPVSMRSKSLFPVLYTHCYHNHVVRFV